MVQEIQVKGNRALWKSKMPVTQNILFLRVFFFFIIRARPLWQSSVRSQQILENDMMSFGMAHLGGLLGLYVSIRQISQ